MDVVSRGDDSRGLHYDRVVRPALVSVRRALVAHYGVQLGTDVAADVEAWAWEHHDQLISVGNVAGYLYRVGQSSARRHRRWERSVNRFPVGGPWVDTAIADVDHDVIDALRRLPTNQRVAVLLVHGYGFSYRDVAELQGVTEAAVTNHVHRGVTRLRQFLDNAS